LRQNFSENWFGVIKYAPMVTPNPLSLYSYKEIYKMFKKKEYYEEVYGYYPIEHIGNLEAFKNLKGDYSDSSYFRFYTENALHNFSITQITFSLRVRVSKFKNVRLKLELHIASTGKRMSMDLLHLYPEITKKMFKDFVDIYNMPNHKYKNMYANIAPDHVKELKYLFSADENSYYVENGPAVFEILRGLKL